MAQWGIGRSGGTQTCLERDSGRFCAGMRYRDKADGTNSGRKRPTIGQAPPSRFRLGENLPKSSTF